MEQKKQSSKTAYVMNEIQHGQQICKEFVKKFFEDSSMYFVFLFSNNEEINYYTVYFLPLLRAEKKISKFLIISADTSVGDMVEKTAKVPYTFATCTEEEMNQIGVYFRQGPGRSMERALINASGCKTEEKIHQVIGYHGITAREVVALAIYGYKENPSDSEIEAALEIEVPMVQGIDWSSHDYTLTEDVGTDFEKIVDSGLDEVLQSGQIRKTDKIILFSVTRTTRYILGRMKDYHIIAVLDNNASLEGSECEGVPVYRPDSFLAGERKETYKIIVPTRSYRMICEQLNAMGYQLNKQVFVTYRENYLRAFNNIRETMEQGEATYDRIRKLYPDDKIYLAPYPGTGDMYLIGMYLKERLKYDGINSCVLVVSSPGCKKILSLFGLEDVVKDVIVLADKEESETMLYFVQGYGYDKANLTVLNDGYGMLHMQPLRGLRGLDFNTMFQKVVFYAPKRITYFDIRRQSADAIFENNNLQKGRTVLLSPYANTITKMSNEIWIKIAKELKDWGYDVCTNVSGDEQPIEGTLGLFIPYTQIVDFLNQAGGFIAFRSGLCDIVSGTVVKKVILYPTEIISYNTTNYDYFSLKRMGFAEENLLEIIVKEEEPDKLLLEILQRFQ